MSNDQRDAAMDSGCDRKRKKVEKRKSKTDFNINSELPSHVIQRIFSKLPIVNLPYCRLVCKSWQDMVLDHASTFKFAPSSFYVTLKYGDNRSRRSNQRLSARVYYIDFDVKHPDGMDIIARFELFPSWARYDIVNSCNGLLLMMAAGDADSVGCCVLNPMTNEFMDIPEEDTISCSYTSFYLYGMGFSLRTKQYKIIRVSYLRKSNNHIRDKTIEIFTLGRSSEWRSLEHSIPFEISEIYPAVSFNGALYWLGKQDEKTKVMWRFDVEDEQFEAVSLPEVDPIIAFSACIEVFNGCLCAYFCDRRDYDHYEIQVWMMRSDGEQESWIREFVIKDMPGNWREPCPWLTQLQLIKICDDGEIVCLVERSYLFSYDPKNGMIKNLNENSTKGRSIFKVFQIESPTFDSLEKMIEAGDCSNS